MNDRHGHPGAEQAWRWPRLLVIAAATLILASCRSLASPVAVPLAMGGVSTAEPTADPPAPLPSPAPPKTAPRTSAAPAGIVLAGCQGDCGPLPRRVCMPGATAGQCAAGDCPTAVCMPLDAPVPMVGPCLVCDGGDHGRPAMPVDTPTNTMGLKHLTSGDTVARYRAAGDGPDTCDVHITASNCACVYAPRFGSVREVTRPHEDARPIGPRGLALDESLAAKVDLQPVCGKTQTLALVAARKALPGVAVEERLGPLAVDQGDMPHLDAGLEQPAEDILEEQLELAADVLPPRQVVGFDVPLVWTCVRGAMVMVGSRQASVVASDRGTATLRIESPGRAELTLCKRAGSDTARVGEELDFMIYLFNSGDRPLADIVLADAIPGRLELVPGSAAANLPASFSTATADDGGVVLTWRFEQTLEPGQGGFVRFRTIVR
jgi:uncharacterized repeat protein (TIGR01451 family)